MSGRARRTGQPGRARGREAPTGQVPVLIDDDRTIWDSLGIILYLAERYPGKPERVLAEVRDVVPRRLGIERKTLYRKALRLGIDLQASGVK